MSPRPATTAERSLGQVVLAGAGQMGGAMLAAWLDAGFAPADLAVVEPCPTPELTERLASAGIRLVPSGESLGAVDILVLAVKPQVAEAAATTLQSLVGPSTLLVSIVAGRTIADLRRTFPQAAAVVRAMPNTPAAVRRGITGVAAEAAATSAHRAAVDSLLQAVGQVEWLPDETLIDAVTAVSGSGPAYVFFFVECLAKAGVDLGLEPAAAMRLARATVEGAGALMAARPADDPGLLRRNVTSPGGTTAAALEVLMRNDTLQTLVAAAVGAAKHRAAELGG